VWQSFQWNTQALALGPRRGGREAESCQGNSRAPLVRGCSRGQRRVLDGPNICSLREPEGAAGNPKPNSQPKEGQGGHN
jgi:hypothetical protein